MVFSILYLTLLGYIDSLGHFLSGQIFILPCGPHTFFIITKSICFLQISGKNSSGIACDTPAICILIIALKVNMFKLYYLSIFNTGS